jgi:hypothetical protein
MRAIRPGCCDCAQHDANEAAFLATEPASCDDAPGSRRDPEQNRAIEMRHHHGFCDVERSTLPKHPVLLRLILDAYGRCGDGDLSLAGM